MLEIPSIFLVPSSVVREACEVVFCDSDCEFVEPQTFSFSRQREACVLESQENMNFKEAPVKALPATRRRATPPTPQQSPPPPPDGTPLQTRPTWPRPPQEPPVEDTTMEVEDQACCGCGGEGELGRTCFQSLLRGSFRHQCCDISDIELKLISVMQVEHGAAQIGKQ